MNIGFFPDFKGSDSVLLSCEPQEISHLSEQLRKFAASGEEIFSVHDLSAISKQHPAQLFASKLPRSVGSAYVWPCSRNEFGTIQAMLEPLTLRTFGHQYFDLADARARLIVSVGEYDDSWWQAHG